MAIEAGLLAVSASENMTPQIMLASVFVGGAAPAIAPSYAHRSAAARRRILPTRGSAFGQREA